MEKKKTILFLTGTRADYGKLKSLIHIVSNHELFDYRIFATGMHTLKEYGMTVEEIIKDNFKNIYTFINQEFGNLMELSLAKTIQGLSDYLNNYDVDLIVVHGDRLESLAGAIVGCLKNIKVAHIEGGEVSGSVDEAMRHAISKLSHYHFVANKEAAKRLQQMGESKESIFVIGSPDVDIMLSDGLPLIENTKRHYDIPYEKYNIAIYHPVATDIQNLQKNINIFIDALLASNENYVVIFPNNDKGTSIILKSFERIREVPKFRLLPSMKFEFFLTLLKNTHCIVGNSSAAIREAPVYGIPAINVGDRQNNRYSSSTIINVVHEKNEILSAIQKFSTFKRYKNDYYFGHGKSNVYFCNILEKKGFWDMDLQKCFNDL